MRTCLHSGQQKLLKTENERRTDKPLRDRCDRTCGGFCGRKSVQLHSEHDGRRLLSFSADRSDFSMQWLVKNSPIEINYRIQSLPLR